MIMTVHYLKTSSTNSYLPVKRNLVRRFAHAAGRLCDRSIISQCVPDLVQFSFGSSFIIHKIIRMRLVRIFHNSQD